MSINAFFDAYSGVQNALGDPRGDARKRQQEDAKNAMLQREMEMKQREMQMKEFEFGQTQAEAQRAEAARQLELMRAKNRAGFIKGTMFPNRTPAPAQAAPAAPMTGGAPLNQPVQGQTFIDDATGKEGASYTASAVSRGAMPTEEEILDFVIQDAAERGDDTYLNDRINLRRKNMSAEEKKGREQIAVISGALINLPDDQLPGAVMQTLQDLNIDLSATKLDDYINDLPKLRRALRVQIALGNPEEAAKEAVRVTGTFEQYRPPEIRDTGGSFRAIGVMPTNAGTTIGKPVPITISPNTQATVGATLRGQTLTNAREIEENAIKAREVDYNAPAGTPVRQQSGRVKWDDGGR